MNSSPSAPDRTSSTRGTWALRDRPGVLWLGLAVLVALAHPVVPGSTWLMVHLVLLGALTHSAMVWSTHFTQALLKSPPEVDDRAQQSRRLLLLLVGTTLVLVSVPAGWWAITVTGATAVSAAVVWHAIQLWRRLRRALPGRFRVTVRYYLIAAGWLPVGATLGATLARGPSQEWEGRLLVAHTMVMLLGWIGLTVSGTLVTLWPTMLRTRIDERAERLARQALPALTLAVAVILTGSLTDLRPVTVAGLAGYAAGLLWWGRALVRPARSRPPREFATGSVGAALGWLGIGIVTVTASVALRPDWSAVADSYGPVAAIFVVGFAAQLLTGALSYLVPSVLGGGPSVVRAGQAWFDRLGTIRLTVVNVGLVLCLLPVPSAVRVACSVMVLAALAAFIPLMFRGIAASVAARRALVAAGPARGRPTGGTVTPHSRSIWSSAQVVGGLAALAVGVTVGVGADPAAAGLSGPVAAASGTSAGAAVTPTGETTRVRVTAKDMRFTPDSVDVPVGNRLVLEVTNTDADTVHDLTFGGDLDTGRLRPGQSGHVDLGVVTRDLDGWCSVVGHRLRGMTFQVTAVGSSGSREASSTESGSGSEGSTPGASGSPDPEVAATGGSPTLPPSALLGDPTPGDVAVDPMLPPLTGPRVHRVTLRVTEATLEVAPGVWQRRWTYNGRVPGPTLHGRVGDTFVVTLVNDADMGHSIDFHAGTRAPDAVMRTVPPGGRLTYRFTAERAGIWMYHCSTAPISAHIAAGMFGAVVIDPPGLPAVDRSYVLVQSETYLDTTAGTDEDDAGEVDAEKVAAERPDAVAFNGKAFQYDHSPLSARVGDRVRIWVLDAGPDRATSFHVVGGQFDTVWTEGAYRLRHGRGALGRTTNGGSQVLSLGPAEGGFVELTFSERGHYPFVSHVMVDAERGAHGTIVVSR